MIKIGNSKALEAVIVVLSDESKKLTVGTYSEGNLLVVYDIRRQVLPTAPSPTTTHLIVCMVLSGQNTRQLSQ